ncbi:MULTISPECIES: nucleoside triphosphate pyrophosphatase [Neisseria]|uniref:dTTP/UTP pyrophosphatase n=1 Tax=Neisseria musculi TaxID=1815583 RepID=A0A7H1MCQ1_9NEIS|nr:MULTISPECIES: Maf family protein [Neisseria]MBF0803800.1 septum formation inhibitor Maf [Neisseria sp. 19428wB4_WF04]QNT59416.1 septum formation protein Maf [Neisseria musculi]TFU43472.1 septum formation inhibitor Maf [Neisseria sp. WF04]
MNTIYLASGSPRRREILENLGYRVARLHAETDETPYLHEAAAAYTARMAFEKNAAAVAHWQAQRPFAPEYPLLSADTTVALHNRILGKPQSIADAADMLRRLSGTTHQVLTAVCVYWQSSTHALLQQSDVTFKTLSEAEIAAYIACGEPMDKAGAYGIQGLGGVFVENLRGSFTGVMGLPVFETVSLLKSLGLNTPPFSDGLQASAG